MSITGRASRGGVNAQVGYQPTASVSGVIPWSILSALYDTCVVSCSASASPTDNVSTSGTGTYYRENNSSDINVSASTTQNTAAAWSFSATFTARFYNR